MGSDALEDVERLEAVAAPIVRLARRRAKLADALRVAAAAARASHRLRRLPRRRVDTERAQLAPSLLAQPLAGPGRREHGIDGGLAEAVAVERIADGTPDDFRGRASRVGGCDTDAQARPISAN